ncbi:hypothetical protein Q1695_011955 [Nippostrongylus brasiliensis]|nr:hypothetical protein Q1695_011955 [Nippostrongylus brasiliensis]
MGFYGEDETFGDDEDRKPSYLAGLEPKRIRLDNPSSSMEEKWRSGLEQSAEDSTPDAGSDEEDRDLEEKAARHEVLRRIGLRRKPTNALRRYLKKVASGGAVNPWLSTVYEERVLKKKLRRFILAMLTKACKDEGVEDSQLDSLHEEAIKFVDRLNEELIESLCVLGNFSSELLRCARKNCQKAFVPNKFAHKLLGRVQGDYTHCQVPECSHSMETHEDVHYLIVEGGIYSEKLEMPEEESPSKLLCLCSFHNGLFELVFDIIHMKWNIYQNCLIHVKEVLSSNKFNDSEDVIAELSPDVVKRLIQHYMARYFCLWVFGNGEQWTRNGCTLFQALYGTPDCLLI